MSIHVDCNVGSALDPLALEPTNSISEAEDMAVTVPQCDSSGYNVNIDPTISCESSNWKSVDLRPFSVSDEEIALAEEVAVNISKIREALAGLSRSPVVHLSGLNLSVPETLGCLVDGLKEIQSSGIKVLELHLVLCALGDDGLRDIMMALPNSLEEVSVKLGFNKLTSEAVPSLYPLLRKPNMKIRSLDLDGNNIGPDGCHKLTKLISKTVEIKDLNIRGNAIGSQGAAWISKGIFERNLSVVSLNVSGNALGDEGVMILSQHLNHSLTKLEALVMKSNLIGPAGATFLAKALKVNRSISNIDLDCNLIGDDGITSLTESIRFNNKITHLNVSDNFITEVGLKALAKYLSSHRSITSIVLRRMSSSQKAFGSSGAAAIADLLAKNSSISSIE
jgi:Ran GTPase-activating protein (RanGAP) involved in mRNA processing and transport